MKLVVLLIHFLLVAMTIYEVSGIAQCFLLVAMTIYEVSGIAHMLLAGCI